MAVINSIAAMQPEMQEWRRWLHRNPELQFDLPKTAAFVADKLRAFGIGEIHEGIATSGIVAIVEGRGDGPTIGLRADMDALPILEATGADHASESDGVMHACGHDGHTAMLLGAAKYLAETRNFKGRVALIFQPAEEGGGGADVMVREGIMDRFDIGSVYGIHNAPNFAEGEFFTSPGPIMAAVDTFRIEITGQGGHGAMPHNTKDPIVAALGIGQAIQTIVSRNHRALDELVVSVTQIHAGSADNIIPGSAWIEGTVRTFDPAVQDMVERRLGQIAAGQAAAYDVAATCTYSRGYPATVNDPERAEFAARVAAEVVGEGRVNGHAPREMGAEDFSYMLEARPGAYLFLGAGPGTGAAPCGIRFQRRHRAARGELLRTDGGGLTAALKGAAARWLLRSEAGPAGRLHHTCPSPRSGRDTVRPQMRDQGPRGPSRIPVARDRPRVVTLGETFALPVADEVVVQIRRGGQVEEVLEDHVDRRRLGQIRAARDEGDALRRVVQRHGEVVGGGEVAARDDHVTDGGAEGFGRHRPARPALAPAGISGHPRVEPQRHARRSGPGSRGVAARPRIDDPVRAVQRHALLRCGGGGGDVPAVAAAGVERAHGPEPVERIRIDVHTAGLAHDRLRPVEAEPVQVAPDRGLPFRPGSRGVDVLDPEQHVALAIRHHRGPGMAQMQRAGGRGGEAGDGARHHSAASRSPSQSRQSALARSV